MSCNIQLNTNGKILSVNADNGEKSLLFATLSSLPFLSKEQAAELYLLAKKQATKNTIKDVNGEPQIVFQPLGGEHEYLLTDKMVTYTDFYKALSLDASERGVRFGILTAKNVEEFNPTNSLEHKKLVEIAKKADSTKTTISTNNTYISDNPKDFILVDKFDRATNTNSKDGFLASLINLGIKIKPKQKTGIPLAIERNNGNPLNLAPNGKPSILFQSYKDLGYSNEKSEELVAKTYSDEFLAWFGDWTKLKTSIKPFKDSADKWDINMMMQPLSSNVGGENKIEFASYIFHSRWFKYKGKNKPNIFHYDNENKELHISGDYPSWRGEYIKFSNIDNFEEATKKFKEYFYENYISDESKSKVGKLVVEKEYSGISKVVDKNGQPLLVFHGTDTANITTFKEKITFFTTKYHLAKDYGSRDVKTVFLNMKTPKEQLDSTYWKFLGEITNENGYYEVLSTDGFASLAKDEGVDGTIMRSIVDTMDKTDTDLISDIFAVFDPNQIKSATENLGDFSLENNDIRFQIIGEQGAKALDSKEEATYRMDNLNVARQMEEAGKTSKEIRLATGWEKHNSLWKYEIPDGELIDKVLKVGEEYPIQEVITDTESSAGLKIIILDEKEFISEEERARYNPVARRIEINERTLQRTFNTYSFREMGYKLPSELRRTISHEIQHDTQRTNGFSGGGNFGTVVERAREIVGDEGVSTNEDLAAKIDTSLKDKDINAEDRKVLEAVQDILSAKTRVEQNTKLEKYYRRIAGEVEARNVEKRLNMSLEERQNNLLSETEDVAREDQILLRNTLGTQASTNNSQELLEGVYEQLKKAKVVDNTYFLSNQEIEDKLRELGYSEDIVKQVSAWHGSPHSFVRFTTEKMGTGEGAQAFGWGLYFTDLESIAKGYAKALTKQLPSFGGKTLNVLTVEKKFGKNKINGRTLNLLQKALSSVNGVATKQNLIDFINENTLLIDTEREEALTLVDKYNDGQNKRNLYKVSLHKGKTPDQYTWLEWDKKIEQKTAKKLAETIASKNPEQFSKDFTDYNKDVHIVPVTHLSNQIADMTGLEFYKSLSRDGYDFLYGEFSKEVNTEKEASLFLLSAGIDGVKYPAESLSRGATSDTARGFNYVVFDENAVTIEEQIQFQIIGEKGSNNVIQEKELLDEAKSLKENNVPLEEIENKTGWLFIDNQWKKLSTALINKFSLKQEAYEKINEPQKLSDVLEDQSIFDYYPTLKAVEIIFYDKEFKLEGKTGILQSKNTLGHFDEFTGENGTLFVKATSKENKLGVTAHELSHKIQQIEGFPEGGNLYTLPNEVKRLIKSSATDVVQLVEDIGNADLSKFSGQELKLIKDTEFALKYLAGSKDEYYLNTMYELLVGEVDATIVENLVKNEENISGNLSYFYKSFLSSKYKTPSDMYVLRGVSDGKQANVKVTTNGFLVKEEKSVNEILRFLVGNAKIEKVC